MSNELMPADKYIVHKKNILTDNDRDILTLLYQPIVGSDAINLYFTLWSSLNGVLISKEKSHHYMMSLMHFDLEKIITARNKLEGIGLLKTYFQNGEINHYVYELYAPLMPNTFLSNPILSASLKKNIGDQEYRNIVDLFAIDQIDFSNYKDISKTFKDVFKVTTYEETKGEFAGKNELDLIDEGLNVNQILNKISDDILIHKLISKEDKLYIKRLSYIYELNDEMLKELIISSVNLYKKIDLIKLRKKCELFFQYENDGNLPSIAYKTQPESLKSTSQQINKRQQMIYFFETTSPRDFLFLKNGNTNLNKNEQQILAYLLLDLKLNPGVVNVLIDYVLRINDFKLVRNFIEVIAMQWKRANIKTVAEAMAIAEKEYNQRKTQQKSKSKKSEKIPEWFNQKITVREPTVEKAKEIEAMLSEYK